MDDPDDVLFNQVEAIDEQAARHMLSDQTARLHHTAQATAMNCAALVDCIDELIQPA
jgi:hypothetical protein